MERPSELRLLRRLNELHDSEPAKRTIVLTVHVRCALPELGLGTGYPQTQDTDPKRASSDVRLEVRFAR
jgi:hypothetical protein